MDHCASHIPDFWTTFRTEQPDLPPSDVANYCDLQVVPDSAAHGSEPACDFNPSYPYLWQVQPPCTYYYAQTVDNPVVEHNEPNFHNHLTSYHEEKHVPQVDICDQVAQRAAPFNTSESILSPLDQETNKLPSELVENALKKEDCVMLTSIMQEILAENGTRVPPQMEEDPLRHSSTEDTPKEAETTTNPYVIRLYACSSCGRIFNYQSHLTQHIKAQHSGPKKERCEVCGKRFGQRDDLEKHKIRHSEDNKKIECKHCPKKFNYRTDMIRHQKAAHTGPLNSCQFCGRPFVRMDHLRNHELRHYKKSRKRTSTTITGN